MRSRTDKSLKLQLHRETIRTLDYRPGTAPVDLATSTCRSGRPCCNED
jgi:hypothetical protein